MDDCFSCKYLIVVINRSSAGCLKCLKVHNNSHSFIWILSSIFKQRGLFRPEPRSKVTRSRGWSSASHFAHCEILLYLAKLRYNDQLVFTNKMIVLVRFPSFKKYSWDTKILLYSESSIY